jgi:HEAT repeats
VIPSSHLTVGLRAATALFALALGLLATPSRVLALATEHFGNDPVPVGFLNLGHEALDLANLKSRLYWHEVNGDPTFFYEGNAAALNEALKKFAALPGGAREVVLLPGRGEGHNLTGDKKFGYDWWVNTPAGFHREGPPRLTVYVGAVAPVTPPDDKQLAQWIADLDSDTFTVREKAAEELARVGHAATTVLRKALADKPSAETRKRIEHLLEILRGIDLRDVKMPGGVMVLEVKDLLARYREGLKAGDPSARGYAVSDLGGLAAYADVVPDLVGVLKEEKAEYPRRCTAGALSRMGKKAEAALALLKAGLNDPDVNVRNAFEHAVKQIEEAKDDGPNKEHIERQRAILEGIGTFRKGLPADSKK